MEEEEILFELGDTVLLVGGQINGLRGRIYYIDETIIRILPDGVSDRLVDLPIVDGDIDPTLKVDHLYSVSKRTNPAFVAQINAEVGEFAETFDKNGVPGPSYKIAAIDEATDSITLIDETEAELKIDANFTGIPLDSPIAVLRPRQPVESEEEEGEALEEIVEDDFDEEFEDVLDAELNVQEVGANVDEIREVPSSQRIYSDAVQRNDMLQEMVSFLDKTSQKNPERHKQIRTIVEQCILLRNTIVEYSKSGEPVGSLPTSILTLADLLKANTVPLSRPVVKAKRVLYLDHSPEALYKIAQGDRPDDPTEVPDADVDIRYLDDTVKETIEYMNTQLGGISSQVLSPDSLPEWYLSWETLNKVYHSTWTVSGDQRAFPLTRDMEFLRDPVIDIESPFVDGLPSLDASAEVLVTADQVTKIRMSVLRGLGPRFGRLKEKEPIRRIESGEEVAIMNTLVFPLSEQQYLGATRSGVIAKDIAYSAFFPQTLMDIMERLDGVPDRPTAGGILLVGEDGNTNGSISIDDWLASQPLYPLGLADVIAQLASYGFSNQEFNVEQQEVIVKKINEYRALIKQFILELRDRMTKLISEQTITENPFLQGEAYKLIMGTIQAEPLLASIVTDLKASTPAYKNNDIAAIAAIMRKSTDLFLASMAQIATALARERNRRVRDQYIEALMNALEKAEVNALSIYTPEPNNCPHVKDYSMIRKQHDQELQMRLFAKYLTRYEGSKQNNWVNCSVCKEHLVCYHEVLLLKEFLHPKEKSAIHKELLLTFSGGVFQGKFICKVCGQPISEIEFDTSLEFTDDGTPISGRAVLEDEPTIQDTLDVILGDGAAEGEPAPEDEIVFKSELQRIIYTGAKRLFDVVGIYAKPDTLKRVLSRVESEMMKQPSAADYKERTKGKRAIDYPVFINRIMVAALAANSLVEIQTNIPGFVMRYKLAGCRAGFSGYPVGNEKDRTGIEYMVCAVSSIRDDIAPWNLTGYQGESSEKRRQEAIQTTVQRVLDSVLLNAAVQQQISMKRAHLQKLYGSVVQSEQLPEKIPDGFRPVPFMISKEDATKAPTIPESATPSEIIRAWVLLAHQIGVENGTAIKGNPFSDATCCLAPIQEPGKFWRDVAKGLPALPTKAPPRGPIDSHVGVTFHAKPLDTLVGSVPPEIIYRIFLKVCYEGPRKGLPHEPGYTNICASCGFVFPESPYAVTPFPPVGSKELMKEYAEEVEAIVTKGKVALQTQGITTNASAFESILDATHRAFKVVPYVAARPAAGMALFESFRTLTPEPFSQWRQIMTSTMEQMSALPAGPSKIDIATAYGALSDFAAIQMDKLKERIGAENAATLQRILEGPVVESTEAVLAYILIPFQRLASGFQIGSLKVSRGYELGSGTEEDINRGLEQHLQFVAQLSKRATGLTLEKIKWTIERLSKALVVLKQNVRSTFIPGGEIGLPYVVVSLIGGILTNFIDPDFIPTDGEVEMVDAGAKAPVQILDVCIQKMRKEGLKFTEEYIKEVIGRRDEIEKNLFIRRFENLSPQEKSMAKRIKQLGLKEWAIGGTNAIQRYDSDQYEVERQQRADMGFTEMFGDDVGGGQGAEEGYDHAQIAEDDY
jgi:hypothetical protein